MTNKFAVYRFIAPFRSRLQNRLRGERMNLDIDAFTRGFVGGDRYPEIVAALWELLRERSFIPDFRPDPADDLAKVFAMDAEIVRDEVVDELLTKFGISVSGIDFTGFDFFSVATVKDLGEFVMKVADAQTSEGTRRFVDITR